MKILFCFLLMMGSINNTSDKHPFHVSLSQCNYNEETDELEITIRVFTDDLEEAIQYSLDEKSDVKKANSLIENYIHLNVFFLQQDKKLTSEYLGIETELDISYLYLRIKNFPIEGEYKMRHTLFFDMFEDQTNIVKLEVKNKSASVFFSGSDYYKTLRPE